ncbi:DDE superfamily endonuclease, partial [Phytophthora infestans]
ALKLLDSASLASSVAAKVRVHRSTIYRWKKKQVLLTNAKAPSKCYADTAAHSHTYVRHPELEKRLVDWIRDMRKNRYLCVTTECLLLMHSKFDSQLFESRSRAASLMYIRRFLKRNRLTIRRITHKGRTKRSDMEVVASLFAVSIQRTIEEDGILSCQTGSEKYSSVYNMEINGDKHRYERSASVFLAASATGNKLPPLIVYAGVPGGPVSQEVSNPSFGAAAVEHTVQKKAFCNEAVMLDWIERIWKPSVYGCRLLILDSLKTHKMASVRPALGEHCCTQVEFAPPGITGVSQPMDVAVMKPFKDYHHIDNPFPTTPSQKRELISRLVNEAWAKIDPRVVVNGFVKAGLIPCGPRDDNDRFR